MPNTSGKPYLLLFVEMLNGSATQICTSINTAVAWTLEQELSEH